MSGRVIALLLLLLFWWLIPLGFIYQICAVYFWYGKELAKTLSDKIAKS